MQVRHAPLATSHVIEGRPSANATTESGGNNSCPALVGAAGAAPRPRRWRTARAPASNTISRGWQFYARFLPCGRVCVPLLRDWRRVPERRGIDRLRRTSLTIRNPGRLPSSAKGRRAISGDFRSPQVPFFRRSAESSGSDALAAGKSPRKCMRACRGGPARARLPAAAGRPRSCQLRIIKGDRRARLNAGARVPARSAFDGARWRKVPERRLTLASTLFA